MNQLIRTSPIVGKYMLPQVIMLDADDTIIDHLSASNAALIRVAKENKTLGSVPIDELSRLWGLNFRKYWRRLILRETTILENRIYRFQMITGIIGNEFSRQEASLVAKVYGDEYISSIKPVEGAIELLSYIREKGMKVVVVSDNIREMQEEKFSKCGMMDYIDELILSGDYGIMKPDPELFRRALEKAGCSASQAVMIGNSYESDVLGANNAGIIPIWFRNNKMTAMPSNGSYNILDSLVPADRTLDYILKVFESSNKT